MIEILHKEWIDSWFLSQFKSKDFSSIFKPVIKMVLKWGKIRFYVLFGLFFVVIVATLKCGKA